VSNFEIRHIEEIREYGRAKPAVNQVEFHPHFTRDQLHEYCNKEGIFFQVFAQIILVTRDFQAFSSLARGEPRLMEEPYLAEVAKAHNITPQVLDTIYAHIIILGLKIRDSLCIAHSAIIAIHLELLQMVLLAWAMNQGVGIVPKSTSPERIIANFAVVDVKLSKEEIAGISALNRNQHYIRCDGWNVL
jgi:diketogulonate reductase-like aldo/keto reductase